MGYVYFPWHRHLINGWTSRLRVTSSVSTTETLSTHWRFVRKRSSSSLGGSRCVPWLGEGLSMSSPNDPVLCCPLPYRVAPVFVQVVSPPLGWAPLSSFLVIKLWSPSGDARGPSVVFEAVNMPCPGQFHFSHSVDYIYEFCPLPDPDVGLSIFVWDVEQETLTGHYFILKCDLSCGIRTDMGKTEGICLHLQWSSVTE